MSTSNQNNVVKVVPGLVLGVGLFPTRGNEPKELAGLVRVTSVGTESFEVASLRGDWEGTFFETGVGNLKHNRMNLAFEVIYVCANEVPEGTESYVAQHVQARLQAGYRPPRLEIERQPSLADAARLASSAGGGDFSLESWADATRLAMLSSLFRATESEDSSSFETLFKEVLDGIALRHPVLKFANNSALVHEILEEAYRETGSLPSFTEMWHRMADIAEILEEQQRHP